MYIWKTASLATEIRNETISTVEWKKYYLAVSIITTVSFSLAAFRQQGNIVAVLIEFIASIVILLIGVNITYQSNKGDSGVDYISRMTALTFPITLKIFVLGSLLGGIFGYLSVVLSISDALNEWLVLGYTVILLVVYFWRIDVHMKYINA